MARPEKNKVDYFPHPVAHGKKMSYIEKKYGNNGYATWFKLLEELGNTDYHYLDLSDEVQLMFLSDRCLVSEEVLLSIIEDLIKLREFDKKLWESNKILFNEKFIESVKEAYKKRSNMCIDKKSLLTLLCGLGILKPPKSTPKPPKSTREGSEKPQSRVDKSKLKKTKLEDTKKKGVVFPFETGKFKSQWEQWKLYKKGEFKFSYKTPQSEQAALSKLGSLSTTEDHAIAILHQSMEHGWKGFFELKTQTHEANNAISRAQAVDQAVDDLLG